MSLNQVIARRSIVAVLLLFHKTVWRGGTHNLNEDLNALEKQRIAAKETRRLGLGVMGIADMLNQLGLGYDSDDGIKIIEETIELLFI